MRPGRGPATWRSLFTVRDFRYLWVAYAVSLVGDQLAQVAVAVLVFGETQSALLTGVVYAMTFVPWLVGGPLLARGPCRPVPATYRDGDLQRVERGSRRCAGRAGAAGCFAVCGAVRRCAAGVPVPVGSGGARRRRPAGRPVRAGVGAEQPDGAVCPGARLRGRWGAGTGPRPSAGSSDRRGDIPAVGRPAQTPGDTPTDAW